MPWNESCVVEERVKFVHEVLRAADSFAETCRRYGVSRRIGYKWLERYQALGLGGLADQSRAPKRPRHGVGAAAIETIVGLRERYPSWGPKKLHAWLCRHQAEQRWPVASTIGEILRHRGLVVGRRRRLRSPPRSAPFAACEEANAVWCVDFKGWFPTGDGSRCEPLTLIDAHSRYLLRCQLLPRTGATEVWPVLAAAFREFGLPEVMRSDNGPPFASLAAGGLSPLAVKLVKAGVAPERIDPGQPQQNGRQERMHLTLAQETASPPAPSLRQQARRFERFRAYYNEERPHEALGQTTPAEHYQASPRPWSGRLREPEYPGDWQVRRVKRGGELRWRGTTLYLNQNLNGEPVGLQQQDDGLWLLYYGPVRLGWIDRKGTFKRPKRSRRKPKTK